jgi:hypothetical protein
MKNMGHHNKGRRRSGAVNIDRSPPRRLDRAGAPVQPLQPAGELSGEDTLVRLVSAPPS